MKYKILPTLALWLIISVAFAAPNGTVYTANEKGNSVSVINLASGQVSNVALTIAPHNVQVSADGSRLLVVGMPAHVEHHPGESGQLWVFGVASLDKPLFTLPAGTHPAHVVTDQTGKLAFVTDSENNAVNVFDLTQQVLTATIQTGKFPHGLRLSPNGKELYVANMKEGNVSVIDLVRMAQVARIHVGKAPVQVGFSPDGLQAYVSLSGENKLGLIDTTQRTLIAKIAVGRTPVQMFATPDGKQVYVANQGSSQQPDDKVSVINPQTRQVITTLTTGKGAHGVAMSTDGNYALVTNIQANTVSVIDTKTQQLIATHAVGAGPNGISYLAP